MSAHRNDTERRRLALAIGDWENEGGAPARHTLEHQDGRRAERDRTLTVDHVSTGMSAHVDGRTMMASAARKPATSCRRSTNATLGEEETSAVSAPSFQSTLIACRS